MSWKEQGDTAAMLADFIDCPRTTRNRPLPQSLTPSTLPLFFSNKFTSFDSNGCLAFAHQAVPRQKPGVCWAWPILPTVFPRQPVSPAVHREEPLTYRGRSASQCQKLSALASCSCYTSVCWSLPGEASSPASVSLGGAVMGCGTEYLVSEPVIAHTLPWSKVQAE